MPGGTPLSILASLREESWRCGKKVAVPLIASADGYAGPGCKDRSEHHPGILLQRPTASASVLTAPLDWRVAMSIEMGLDRLKDQFLDVSSQRQDTWNSSAPCCAMRMALSNSPRGSGKPAWPGSGDLPDSAASATQRSSDFWHTHGAHGPSRAVFSPYGRQSRA